MKIIIPMAGMGKRMRPHTLTIPKPLLTIAGKPIVQRLVEDIVKVSSEKVDEIGFVIGNFGKEVEDQLIAIATAMNAKGRIFYQYEPLGTAHAILCAAELLQGKVTVAFADTLFRADFVFQNDIDGIIWVHKVKDPSSFGVVKTDSNGIITDFIEKPKEFISDLAIIGIYYFKQAEILRNEMQFLIDNNIVKGNEYQLTDALQNMMKKGMKFSTGTVNEWLDCGNKDAMVHTNKRILHHNHIENLISPTIKTNNAIIIKPCFIGENVEIDNSIIGPYVSIGNNTKIKDSIITNSIIQSHTTLVNANVDNSMIGNYVDYKGTVHELNIGDYTAISQ